MKPLSLAGRVSDALDAPGIDAWHVFVAVASMDRRILCRLPRACQSKIRALAQSAKKREGRQVPLFPSTVRLLDEIRIGGDANDLMNWIREAVRCPEVGSELCRLGCDLSEVENALRKE
jgi:hypothetical protein